jgi:hypothetical protein
LDIHSLSPRRQGRIALQDLRELDIFFATSPLRVDHRAYHPVVRPITILATMSDFNYGGTEEESAEIKKLNADVVCSSFIPVRDRSCHGANHVCAQLEEPDNFDNWEKLVRAAETLEGGLNRNSSPQAIATTRDAYDRFLAKFPLLFGYWKKYADLEFSIAGTEAAEMVRRD